MENSPMAAYAADNDSEGALAEHFFADEFDCHDGTPVPETYLPELSVFCERNLEPLRKFFGVPILVRSGYRTQEHNQRVGGSKRSYHVYTMRPNSGVFAVDIAIPGVPPVQIRQAILGLINLGVMEQGGVGLYQNWVHYDNRGVRKRWIG